MGRMSKADQSEANANEKIQERLSDISLKLRKVKTKNEKVNEALKAIKTQGERLISNGKLSQSNKQKIGVLYDTAMNQCKSEEQTLRSLLSDIEKVRRIQHIQKRHSNLRRGELMQLLQQQARTLPLWIGGIDGHPPPLVGALALDDDEKLAVGDYVAAFDGEYWIMSEVKENLSSGKVLVKDIDDESDRTLTIKRELIIPLPKYRSDPKRDGHALFPRDSIVLALYPQTTCFYKGVVDMVPVHPTDDYMIMFEDPAYTNGLSPAMAAPQGFVITYRETRTGKGSGRKKKNKY